MLSVWENAAEQKLEEEKDWGFKRLADNVSAAAHRPSPEARRQPTRVPVPLRPCAYIRDAGEGEGAGQSGSVSGCCVVKQGGAGQTRVWEVLCGTLGLGGRCKK